MSSIIISCIAISFIIGLLIQGILQRIEPHKTEFNSGTTRASKLIPWTLKVIYINAKIRLLSKFRDKEKVYLKQMRQEYKPEQINHDLLEVLVNEEKTKNVQSIIEVVIQSQMINMRKKKKPLNFFYQYGFFVPQMFINEGPRRGAPLVSKWVFYIYNEKQQKNYQIPPEKEKAGVLWYGTADEWNAYSNMDDESEPLLAFNKVEWRKQRELSRYKKKKAKYDRKQGESV